MKKLLLLAILSLISLRLFASVPYNAWMMESTLGPGIDIKNSQTQFDLQFRIGKKYFKGGMDFGFGDQTGVRPNLTIDIPFFFGHRLSVGPTFDIGPNFWFGPSAISFLQMGFGVRTSYLVRGKFGVVITPMHISMDFVRWVQGQGTHGVTALNYHIKFGVFYAF
jgi:hypothetical protein